MAFCAFAFSFFDPNIFALTWTYSRCFMVDDGGVQLFSSHIRKLNLLENIQQIGAEQSHFSEVELTFMVNTRHRSYAAVFERKELSSEELELVLGCCDQRTDNPMQAIANTRACWEKLFPDERRR